MNAVGGHIRKLRKRDSMTQQALADRLNVTRQAVSQWEMGNTQPDLDTLAAIAGVFGVDMMEVIYGEKRKETFGIDPARRKRYLTGLIVFGVIAAVARVAELILGPYIDEWSSRYYDYRPAIILGAITGSLFYISLVFSALNGGSLLWDIRIQSRKARRLILVVSIVVIVLLYAVVFCFCFSIELEGMISWVLFDLNIFLFHNPAIFLLPGIGLFLGLNGHRMGPELECRR
jgi:transcriptional regulator with XRE-family HTH domain